MPHPDYRIADVPLRLDQISALLIAISNRVANSPDSREYFEGPTLTLVYELRAHDSEHLIPTSSYIKDVLKKHMIPR